MTSRRHFIGAAAATMLAGASTTARAADSTPAADSRKFRLGLSQPKDSPNYLRLKEMADRIAEDTRGAIAIEIFPESQLGNDSAMIAMVQKGELEMYLGGNVFGPLVPMTEMPGLPFTFRNSPAVFEALDNDLGDIIRAELAAKGLHAFRYGFDNGFHQITTSNKPIRTVDDLAGMKIRTPVQTMTVEFFQALGAKPMTFTLNKLYEVQAYLSLTHHWWSGFTLVANEKAWNALPDGIRSKIEMHAKAAALLQRQDVQLIDGGAVELLRGKGMIVNTADTSGFRKPLSAFYARWKGIYGDKAWAALEARVGKLV